MVGIGQPSIADVSFRNPRHPVVGVHAMRLKELYRRTAGTEQPARHRVPVHLLALLTAGRANFTVDFATYPCRPGGLLWVRPGQFVGFPPPGIDATLVLFEPEFPYAAAAPGLSAIAGRPGGARIVGTYWQPTGEDEEAIVDGVSQLEIDYTRIVSGDDIPLDVLRHQLAALLLRVARLEPEGGPGLAAADSEILVRFRQVIDERFAKTRQVEEYARALGCSVRTLTRASLVGDRADRQAARGRSGGPGGQAAARGERPGRRGRRGAAGFQRSDELWPVFRPYGRIVTGPVPRREPPAGRRGAPRLRLHATGPTPGRRPRQGRRHPRSPPLLRTY